MKHILVSYSIVRRHVLRPRVCLSIRLSQPAALSKRRNVASCNQHHIIVWAVHFSDTTDLPEIPLNLRSPQAGAKYARGKKNRNFRPVTRHISELAHDKDIVTMEGRYEVVCTVSNGDIADDQCVFGLLPVSGKLWKG